MFCSIPQALRFSSASIATSSKLACESVHVRCRASQRYTVGFTSAVASRQPKFTHILSHPTRSSSSHSTAPDESSIAHIAKHRYEALIESEIVHFANALTPHPITLQQILSHEHADSLRKFLLEELPIRYARRIALVESLQGWQNFPHMRVIRGMYSNAFRRLRMITQKDAEPFRKCLLNIRQRHRDILKHVIRGTREMKAAFAVNEKTIDEFLNDFCTGRMGTDLLISQYLEIARSRSVIDAQLDPVAVIKEAARDAIRICKNRYGHSPGVDICHNDEIIKFPFIPVYMHYMIFELLKNSLRAMVERHEGNTKYPVSVTVSGDDSTVVIRVSDAGGGIPLEELHRVWSYNYSTATPVGEDLGQLLEDSDSEIDTTPMAGFGVGLPLSRTHATYVGGKLELNTMPHYGTDAYLYLNRIGNAEEQLVFPYRGLHVNV